MSVPSELQCAAALQKASAPADEQVALAAQQPAELARLFIHAAAEEHVAAQHPVADTTAHVAVVQHAVVLRRPVSTASIIWGVKAHTIFQLVNEPRPLTTNKA